MATIRTLTRHVVVPRQRPVSRNAVATVALLVLAAVVRVPTLVEPLLELHSFRQTQTAYTALLYAQDGIDLLHTPLPVLGPPYEVPFEFPLPQALASLLISAGVGPDLAMRLFGLATFLAAAGLVFLVASEFAGAVAGAAALAIYTFSPANLLWGRASTIEYAAIALTLAAVYGALRAMQPRAGIRWFVVGGLAAILAAMVKLPTCVCWILAVGAVRVATPHRLGRRDLGVASTFVVAPLAAGLLWTMYADAIKAGSPLTNGLTTSSLRDFTFGSLELRADVNNWFWLGILTLAFGVGIGSFSVLAYHRSWISRVHRVVMLGLLSAAIGPVVVFFGLYVHNDYYMVEILPASSILIGIAFSSVRPRFGRPIAIGIAVAISVVAGIPYWSLAWQGSSYDPGDWLSIAEEIDANSTASQDVLVLGADWSPATLYYARRRGVAAGEWITPSALKAFDLPYGLAVVLSPERTPLDLLSVVPWVGSLSKHTYAMGTSPADVSAADASAGVLASDPPGAVTASSSIVRCAETSTAIAVRPGLSVIELTAPNPSARLWLAPDRAPLPLRRHIIVRTADTHVELRCSGTDHIEISRILSLSVGVPK